MSTIDLELEDVHHSYLETASLKGVSIKLSRGEIGCILGPSGSGKTTLLRCIAGFEPITKGRIEMRGQVLSEPGRTLPPEKRRIGIVFQEHALFPHLRVSQNITFGLRHLNNEQKQERVRGLLQKLGVAELAERLPHELSGGQAQRVALARALAPEPTLLLLDEPFSSLDERLRGEMKRELKSILRSFDVTTLLITHRQDEAFDIADQLGVVEDGQIMQWGQPLQLYMQPESRKLAEFFGRSSFLKGTLRADGVLETELGQVKAASHSNASSTERLVLLRPHNLLIDSASPHSAEVVDVTFRGIYRLYHLRLPSGCLVECLQFGHDQQFTRGSKLRIRLNVDKVIIFDNQA